MGGSQPARSRATRLGPGNLTVGSVSRPPKRARSPGPLCRVLRAGRPGQASPTVSNPRAESRQIARPRHHRLLSPTTILHSSQYRYSPARFVSTSAEDDLAVTTRDTSFADGP